MATIDPQVIKGYLDDGANGTTTSAQGKALENLVCYLFECVPGVSVTRRNTLNTFHTEEIDVAFWNEAVSDGFFFLPNIILVECKNWSSKVGSSEVSWFETKLRHRGQDFGILVATKGVTGVAADLSAAHNIVATALKDRRKLIIITESELLALTDSTQLVTLLKEKLCDLAVSGTLV